MQGGRLGRLRKPIMACANFHYHGPRQVAVLTTSSDHLPCILIMIPTDAPQGVQKQVPGAEAEDTQDLASPAKTVSRFTPQD